MPIRMPRRAAGWCRACSEPSTASTRSSSKVSPAADAARLRDRKPDGARLRRAVLAVRPAGAHDRNRRCAQLRHILARSRGALLRRHAGDRGGRALFLAACCAITAVPITAPIIPRSPAPQALDARTVRFDLGGSNDRELPLILGLMPVLPKHAIDVADVRGYDVGEADRQRTLRRRRRRSRARASRFKRDPNYWGRDLPINRGLWNFEELRFDYYRDANAYFEAFKTGLYDVRTENDPSRWQTGYDIPAVRDGRIVKEAFANGLPKVSSNFVFNTRRADLFRHPRAPGDRAPVRCRMDQPQLLLRSLPPEREFLRRFRTVGVPASGRCARARAARAVSRTRCAPTCSTAPGRRRPATAPAATARACTKRSSLLDAAGYELKGTTLRERTSGRPFTLRDHGDEPRR